MMKKDIKAYFGSASNAARAAGISKQYLHKMPDPIPRQWGAVFEVLSHGALKSGINHNG